MQHCVSDHSLVNKSSSQFLRGLMFPAGRSPSLEVTTLVKVVARSELFPPLPPPPSLLLPTLPTRCTRLTTCTASARRGNY